MIRVLFLLLFFMSSAVSAQTQEQPKAVKIDEFQAATEESVKMSIDGFFRELSKNPSAQGYIINYGTENEISYRERQVKKSIAFLTIDLPRISIIRGGFGENFKTEFWLVPFGAEKPKPSSTGEKIDEFEKVSIDELKARLDNLYTELNKSPKSQGYILNYGSKNEIIARETQIKRNIGFLKLDLSKVTIKNAGVRNGVKTEFWLIPANGENKIKTKIWIVPPGAKPPTQ